MPALASPLASAASFASPTDPAGTIDLVTIAVADADGRPISGLTNGDFALALSGGTSTGTVGPVAEFGTSGTYYTVFTGTLTGTALALTVSVDGTTLSHQPTVRVTPGAVSASDSTMSVAPSASNVTVVTIRARDVVGNPITDLPGSAFQFGLSGGAPPLTATFGPVIETATPGTYTASLTANTAGGSVLTVTVNGTRLDSQVGVVFSSGQISVTEFNIFPPINSTGPGPIAQIAFAVSVASPTVASGTTDVVTLVVTDTAGNVKSGLLAGDFTLGLSAGSVSPTGNQPVSAGSFGPVTETATPGTYTATFTGKTAGTPATLTVSVGGVSSNSRPSVQVTPGAVSASRSAVSVAPSVNAAGVVALGIEDAAGNAVTGLSGSAFQLTLSGGTSAGMFGPATETAAPGVYAVTLTGTAAGTPSTLSATVGGIPLIGRPTVQVTRAAPAATAPEAPAAATPPPPAPVFTGAFMFGNVMVLAGSGFPGGFAVVPLPPGCLAFFADANGDGNGDVVLFVPHLIVVLDGLSGSALAVPF